MTPDVIAAIGPSAGDLFPSTRAETINVLAHYYRAEIARMAGWRDRLDRTSNWAITVVAAMLSVSLSTQTSHHGVLLFGMVLVSLLLVIEARRYRFFDVYRRRVRRLERNYFAQIFAPEREGATDWARAIAADLREPRFVVSRREAISRRLRRNYIWMYLILFFAWLLKITSAKLQAGAQHADDILSPADWVQNAAIGPVPGWLVASVVALFYVALVYAAFRAHRRDTDGDLLYGPVHV